MKTPQKPSFQYCLMIPIKIDTEAIVFLTVNQS